MKFDKRKGYFSLAQSRVPVDVYESMRCSIRQLPTTTHEADGVLNVLPVVFDDAVGTLTIKFGDVITLSASVVVNTGELYVLNESESRETANVR